MKETSRLSKARIGVLTTPHGVVKTPNFVFCATKGAMKSVTTDQLRAEGTEIMLSNTYHLMLAPGAETVAKLGGLQKMTAWHGPMLTDSGGYQIFSMGFGSVSNEVKGKRDIEGLGWNKTLLRIDEEGAVFRSYVDGSQHTLTPEKCIDIQRQLGADLVVVLDECTPFNVDKTYTADSMRRSHRWAIRCLHHFKQQTSPPLARTSPSGCPQAIYGIVQGGVYEDLRKESCQFVNDHPFFGLAIGGSLGASKQEMHAIVRYTRSLLRNDRPVHLLGIGGVRDIFHGVRQGIDTFDCVHPTRLGRHGSALVMAHFWDEDAPSEKSTDDTQTSGNDGPQEMTNAEYEAQLPANLQRRLVRLQSRLKDRLRSLYSELATLNTARSHVKQDITEKLENLNQRIFATKDEIQELPRTLWQQHVRQQQRQWDRQQTQHLNDCRPVDNKAANETLQSEDSGDDDVEISSTSGSSPVDGGTQQGRVSNAKMRSRHGRVREHVHLSRASMRHDTRPIDSTCTCYTCRNVSRGYLHHLLKAGELLGGSLVTIHNIAFMNRLMRDIRTAIKEDNLDELERRYVHPELAASIGDTLSIGN